MTKPHAWMQGSGQIVDRTNTTIAGLLDWADKTNVNTIKRRNIEDAIKSLTPVNGEDTVRKYVERVVDHGPFIITGTAIWSIQWDRVELAREESSTGDTNE